MREPALTWSVGVDAVVFASRTGVRLELAPAPRPHRSGRGELPAWRARLTGPGIDASLVCPEAGWGSQPLADYLATLGADWRGWAGGRAWESDQAELRLSARHDRANTVVVEAVLADGARWRASAELALDPGVLRQLASEARRLAEASLAL